MTGYTCATCRASVSVVDGLITRTCAHSESAVLADMEATAYGEGHTDATEGPLAWLRSIWRAVFGGDHPLACATCGAPAVRKNGTVLRACGHIEAGTVGG